MIESTVNRRALSVEPPLRFNPYSKPVQSTRSGALFRVHAYATKINYKAIVPFILAHTRPGDIVYDCFAGTCSTGFAAASCVEEDPDLISQFGPEAAEVVEWGMRNAVCIDIGVLPTFIAHALLQPVDIKALKQEFDEWIRSIEEKWSWVYETKDLKGKLGKIRYTYLSEVIECPNCGHTGEFIEMFVDFDACRFKQKVQCPSCSFTLDSKNIISVMEESYDRVLGKTRLRRKRVPYLIFGKTGSINWSRRATKEDNETIHKIERVQLPDSIKPIPMLQGDKRWGEMYRSGYHQDITFLHHFYSPRNLLAVSILYDSVKELPEQFKLPILLAISSYNAAHSTLMTRFVFKKGSVKPVNTSAQPGALYIPKCPVEKNVFVGVEKKFADVLKALRQVSRWNPRIEIERRPAQASGLESSSIDYIFTDPPFGGNIQYSELNFLSEAWLDSFTDNRYETVLSDFQNKAIKDYEALLTQAFRENFRVLKPDHFMTVVFHSRNKEVWNALRRAIIHSGFEIIYTSILNKTQKSFKQTTTRGAVKKDPIILARKRRSTVEASSTIGDLSPVEFLRHHLKSLGEAADAERTFDYLFGRYVGYRLTQGKDIPVDAAEFKKFLSMIAERRGNLWYLNEEV